MPIAAGDKLPDETLIYLSDEGPKSISVKELTAGKRVALFGLPGPFTGTCSSAHLPSFIRTRQAFADKGIDDVICVAVTDVFVMKEWAKQTGAEEAGITMLVDGGGEFAKALGLAFSVPAIGFSDRLARFAAIISDGTVETINIEKEAGVCGISAGETLLEAV